MPNILSVKNMTKKFPGVIALKEVSLDLEEGEILAVIGENGAGKSTLMKILAGVQPHDKGQTFIRDQQVDLTSVQKSSHRGIALIHQELNLPSNLSVGACIFLGREPGKNGFFNSKVIQKKSEEALHRVGLNCTANTQIADLAIGKKQLVEIAKALSADAKILIFDEPTSSLSTKETERLYEVIFQLKNEGVSMIYISHRLAEVEKLADRVLVLRDGENAGLLKKEEISHENMVRLMVGRDISQFYQRTPHETGDTALELDGFLSYAHPDKPVSFSVKHGEIVGISGLVGAGRTELIESLFGVHRSIGGTVKIDGTAKKISTPRDAIDSGLALVPEDRKLHGLILEMSMSENGTLPYLENQTKSGFINFSDERTVCADLIDKLKVKTSGPSQIIQYLSGGNQQKVVIGKWLATKPKILLLDEPTRGIDIGAKQEVYRLMHELAGEGIAILFVSSEMEEIIGMSDRLLVMHEGNISGELTKDEFSEENIMMLATGRKTGETHN